MGGERISQEIITEPVESNTQEGEVDGISDEDFLKSIGVNPEKRSDILNQLESYFEDRVFHYGQYSGTIAEMVKCPVFYDKLEEGFDAAVSWLLEYDELQEETDKANLLAEDSGSESESIDTDIDSRQTQGHGEKVEIVELPSLPLKKVLGKTVEKTTSKNVAVKKSNETKPGVRDGVAEKIVSSEYVERLVTNVERVIPVVKGVLEKTVVAEATEPIVERIEQKPDIVIEAIQPVEPGTIEPSEVIIKDTEPIQAEVVEKQQEPLFIEPQENISTFLIPQTSIVETPKEMPVSKEVDAEAFVTIQETEVAPSPIRLEQMLPAEDEPVANQLIEVEGQVEQSTDSIGAVSIIETVIALTNKVPEVITDIEPDKVYYQADEITQKIKVFETLTTAEECRDALDSLCGELELLLTHLGYKNAEEIAMNLLRQHDIKMIAEYMTVLKRSISQSYNTHNAPHRIVKALLPYHRYGSHAVRSTVTSYA